MSESVGEKIRSLMARRGVSLREMERRGINRVFLAKVIQGEASPSWGYLERVAEALGCSAEVVFKERK